MTSLGSNSTEREEKPPEQQVKRSERKSEQHEVEPVPNAPAQEKINPVTEPPQPTQGSRSPIETAQKNIQSNDTLSRIYGIEELARISPADAVSAIFEALYRLEDEPDIDSMIALGILKLASYPEYLTNEDLTHIIQNYDSDTVAGRAAKVLASRGDDALLTEHIQKFSLPDTPLPKETALQNLVKLGAIQSRKAEGTITPYLTNPDEDIRFQALLSMTASSNKNGIKYVEPLLNDSSEKVREKAKTVIYALEHMRLNERMPLDVSIGSDVKEQQE